MSQAHPDAWGLSRAELYAPSVPLVDDSYAKPAREPADPDPLAPLPVTLQAPPPPGAENPGFDTYTEHDQTGALRVTLGRQGRLLAMKLAVTWRSRIPAEQLEALVNDTLMTARFNQANAHCDDSTRFVVDPTLSPYLAQEEMWRSLARLRQVLTTGPPRPYRIWNNRRTMSMRYAQGLLGDLHFESASAISAPAQLFNSGIYEIIHTADEEERDN